MRILIIIIHKEDKYYLMAFGMVHTIIVVDTRYKDLTDHILK
jgi:hypothetical protein